MNWISKLALYVRWKLKYTFHCSDRTSKHSAFWIYWIFSKKLKYFFKENKNSLLLKKNGFSLTEEPIEPSLLQKFQTKLTNPELNWITTTPEAGYQKLKDYNDPSCEVLHFEDIWSLFPKEEILNLVEHHFGKTLKHYYNSEYKIVNVTSYITRKSNKNFIENSFIWHIDDHPPGLIKGFFYLSDTGPENGPFCFIPGSHVKNHLKNQDCTQKTDCRFSQTYIDSLKTLPRTITGKAGTGFLVNANCLHRATPVISDNRQVLSFIFLPSTETCSEHLLKYGSIKTIDHPDRIHIPVWGQ